MKEKLEAYLSLYLNPPKEKHSFFLGGKMAAASASPMNDYEYMAEDAMECARCATIDNFIEKNKEETTFQTKLFEIIDSKELKDSDVYNEVNIDRRLFSKIRSNKDYHPSKDTIILLGIALKLEEEEIEELLSLASYSLPMNTTYDLIIRFCFKEHIYDVQQINEFLYDHKCKLLNE